VVPRGDVVEAQHVGPGAEAAGGVAKPRQVLSEQRADDLVEAA